MSSAAPIEDILEAIGPDDSEYETSGDEYFPSKEELRDLEEEEGPTRTKKKRKLKMKDTGAEEEGLSGTKKKKKKMKDFDPDSESSDDDEVPLAVLRDRQNGWEEDDDLPLATFALQEINGMEDLAAVLNQPIWSNIPFQPPDVTFTGTLEPPPERLKTPYQYFKELITDEMLDSMEKQTNLYSMQKEGKVVNTTSKEIEMFIGLYLRMGLVQAHSVRAYWAAATRYPPVADYMARERFKKLATSIHFTDNLEVTEEDKSKDRLWKIRPWLESIQRNLDKITPEEHQAVDEIVIAFKGQSSLKQYLRNKPHKWGFKMWARCGSCGIVYQFDVYQGSQQQKEKSALGVAGEVVLQMTAKLPEGQNYKIFADNLFTSLPLVTAMKEKGLCFVGTVRANRLKGCELKSDKDLKKEGRGSSHSLVEFNTNAAATRWFDNRTVDLLSTYKGVDPQEDVRRWDKKAKEYITIRCPAVVREYNKFMGGVDLLDSLTALYKYPIKSRRWYMYLFFHTIAMAVVNAWLWYKRHCLHMNEKPMKLADFQLEISGGLVNRKRTVGRPSAGSPSPTPVPRSVSQCPPTEDSRFDNVDHLPEWGKRGRCKNKSCDSLSFVRCMKCCVFLCLNKDRNCFAAYHKK